MELIELILLIVSVITLSSISESYLKKRFQIVSRDPYFYKPINKLQRYGEFSIHLVFWIALLVVMARESEIIFQIWIFSYLLIGFGFRFLMQHKFERKQRHYILTINSFIWSVLFITLSLYMSGN
ncbi:DUF4181 domain-containing protein [Bacillus litorisediminis]|uniref:DUF4181 domain-containing protein n=1 Tax=Bacillus litorisediminis TaxID=2922713 RepID=UPI001FAF408F|nr:DUF4181 domain-containing protein [Bacillus litorisediminis]